MRIFKNYIGLRGCVETTPRGNFWINQMAGVSLKSLDKISNSENKTYSATWDNIQERCCLIINEAILQRINSRVIMPVVKDQLKFGQQSQTFSMNTSSNDLVGIKIYGSLDRYERIQLTSFIIYSEDIFEGFTYYIYDLNNGLLVKTASVNLVSGFNEIYIDLELENYGNILPNYFLCYDNSLFQSNNTVSSYDYDGLDCGLSVNINNVPYGYSISANGAINVGKQPNIKANITAIGNTYGIILNFNQKCSIEEFIAPIIDRFKLAWAYLLLSEIIQERKLSERFNIFTTEYTDEQFDEMYDKYINESNKYLDIAFKNMNIPLNGCFSCNERFQQTFAMP
jgi:hypothetical protein